MSYEEVMAEQAKQPKVTKQSEPEPIGQVIEAAATLAVETEVIAQGEVVFELRQGEFVEPVLPAPADCAKLIKAQTVKLVQSPVLTDGERTAFGIVKATLDKYEMSFEAIWNIEGV